MGRIGDRPYWALMLSILVRAAHQVGAAVFLAAYLLDSITALPRTYTVIVLLSGILLLGAEWWRHRQIFREPAGLVTTIKILLMGAASHGLLPLQTTMLLVFVIASVMAHSPKRVRHRILF
ncbi:MAG: hypothetical protein GWO30_04350 [Gammaproteobacteria bacterium]|nr:hypothetical protein [Gammaproteobacteria bacterium]NIY19689.1 hypothetical protein [Gammaproteobacteria bacterium]